MLPRLATAALAAAHACLDHCLTRGQTVKGGLEPQQWVERWAQGKGQQPGLGALWRLALCGCRGAGGQGYEGPGTPAHQPPPALPQAAAPRPPQAPPLPQQQPGGHKQCQQLKVEPGPPLPAVLALVPGTQAPQCVWRAAAGHWRLPLQPPLTAGCGSLHSPPPSTQLFHNKAAAAAATPAWAAMLAGATAALAGIQPPPGSSTLFSAAAAAAPAMAAAVTAAAGACTSAGHVLYLCHARAQMGVTPCHAVQSCRAVRLSRHA
ncbi:hypothetical protein HaLaN_00634 [Haematococcus lacustris]|uniref:Uncharacterized protein n=1 Tax=Haematococcus lacustris TaxID=44745 RepID=A0A699YGA8_HAELA|nr:hypothetical protein HaLaN_00634 [Haematococcus lacustris]